MTPRKTPVASFGPELLETLLSGATRFLHIQLTYREAVRFRLRLYQLRYAMRQETHPRAQDAQRVFVRILWGEAARRIVDLSKFGPPEPSTVQNSKRVVRPEHGNTPCVVVVGPQDSDFSDALKAAGIEISIDSKPDPLEGLS